MIKIAILSFEHVHAPSYARCLGEIPGAEFVAFSEQNDKRRKQVSKDYPKVSAYKNWKMLLKAKDCDAVIITSANSRHCEMAVASAVAGKHILCEKPIATTLADAKKMLAAAKKHGVKFMTAFPVRYCAAIKRAKDIIAAGELGEIWAVKATNHGTLPGGWFSNKRLSGGGAIMDHTVHVVDLLRYLFEEEIVEVYAEAATKIHPIKVEDCGLIMMRMQRGVFASLDTSWSRPQSYKIWGDVTIQIKGSQANLYLDCFPPSCDLYQNKTMRHTSLSTGDDFDLYMLRDFISAVKKDVEPAISGNDGLRALEVTLAAYSSIRKRSPVSIQH